MGDTDEASAWIDLVLERASELRAAGVLSIGLGGCNATLAPAEPTIDTSKIKVDEVQAPRDPFHDPASYPGGYVPGYRIEPLETEE